jgi:hypothetical protein
MNRLPSLCKRVAMFCGAAVLFAAQPAPLWAAKEITFVFRTTIDATPVGGAPNTPLTVTYTFDPDLRSQGYNDIDPDQLFIGYYTPVHMVIQLGEDSVKATQDTNITVWNIDDDDDGIGVGAVNYALYDGSGSSIKGTLFGYEVLFFGFLLDDSDATMFDNAHLPLTADYAAQADFQQTTLSLLDPVTGEVVYLAIMEQPDLPPDQYTPFSLELVTKESP